MNYKQVDVLVSRISVHVLERWLRVGVGGQKGEGCAGKGSGTKLVYDNKIDRGTDRCTVGAVK